MKTSGPLYLAVIDHIKTSVWFKTNLMGVHTISIMVKCMKLNCPALKNSTKKLTNHAIRELRENGFQKSEIKNITGHASVQGLDAYDTNYHLIDAGYVGFRGSLYFHFGV